MVSYNRELKLLNIYIGDLISNMEKDSSINLNMLLIDLLKKYEIGEKAVIKILSRYEKAEIIKIYDDDIVKIK